MNENKKKLCGGKIEPNNAAFFGFKPLFVCKKCFHVYRNKITTCVQDLQVNEDRDKEIFRILSLAKAFIENEIANSQKLNVLKIKYVELGTFSINIGSLCSHDSATKADLDSAMKLHIGVTSRDKIQATRKVL